MPSEPTKWLLTKNNSRLSEHGIFTWTLPAESVKLPDGRNVNVCPAASVCREFCYARRGMYQIPSVKQSHVRKLLLVHDHLEEWKERMEGELRHSRYQHGVIRLHDSGDFYNDAYLLAWLDIMRGAPKGIEFYAYTHEIERFKRLVESNPPSNFRWVYSLGGKQDALIDRDNDRHADVFPDAEALEASRYSSQAECDTLAVTGPPLVGMALNQPRKALGDHSFGSLQRARDHEAEQRRQRQKRRARTSGKANDGGQPQGT